MWVDKPKAIDRGYEWAKLKACWKEGGRRVEGGGRRVEGGCSRAVICLCAPTWLAACKSGMIPNDVVLMVCVCDGWLVVQFKCGSCNTWTIGQTRAGGVVSGH